MGGLLALVIAKCFLVGSGALLLFFALSGRDGKRARGTFAVLFLASMLLARDLLLLRPVIVTLVFLALQFYLLERFRRQGRARLLALLPLVQVAWVNTQGLFALGLAVVLAYALGAASSALAGERAWFPFAPESPSLSAARQAKWLGATLLACVFASVLSPFGLRALALPAGLLARLLPAHGNVFSANVAENVPPFDLAQFWHLKWFLVVLAASFFMARRRPLASHVALVFGFVLLAVMANRNVLLLYWMATPIAALNLAPAVRAMAASLRRYRGPLATRWIGRSAIASLVCLAAVVAAREPALAEPAPFRVPADSARIMRDSPDEGSIFAADHHGGYFIWSLHPRFRPYMDTRLVLRTPDEYEDYLAVARDPARFDDLDGRLHFAYVALPVAFPDRYLGLVAHLYASARWRLVFTNGTEVLFRARASGEDDGWDLGDPATTERVLARARERYSSSPSLFDATRLQLATLDIATGEHREAERILACTEGPEVEALRARARLSSDDLDAAERIGQRLLASDGDDVRTLDLLALVHARRGDHAAALRFLRKALAIDPLDGEANQLVALMEERHEQDRHEP
jgi:tetratricopeptide (TPR) repeat protein